jgi:hypothetical protein
MGDFCGFSIFAWQHEGETRFTAISWTGYGFQLNQLISCTACLFIVSLIGSIRDR